MVIDDLHVAGVVVSPAEADPPLIVDPDAVLALPVACQCLQPVPRGYPEILQRYRGIQQVELSLRLPLDVRGEFPGSLAPEKLFGLPAMEMLWRSQAAGDWGADGR